MKNICSLALLPENQTGIIVYVNCDKNIKNRMFDLGIIENAEITPLFKSPFGDPKAFLVKNAVIALRKRDYEKIIVTPDK